MRAVAARRIVPLLVGAVSRRAGFTTMQIEVERKFEPPTDVEALSCIISTHGGEKVGEKTFSDTYYDTAACALTSRDTWLRRRDGAWELKLPVDAAAKRSGGERTVFREVEGTVEVNSALSELVDGAGQTLEDTLRSAALVPFAEFSTVRTKWKLGRASIDADIASFGHAVMEIEVMCANPSEVAQAEEEIAGVAELIGAKPLGALGGKLETYIRRHAPKVLAALVEAGILLP